MGKVIVNHLPSRLLTIVAINKTDLVNFSPKLRNMLRQRFLRAEATRGHLKPNLYKFAKSTLARTCYFTILERTGERWLHPNSFAICSLVAEDPHNKDERKTFDFLSPAMLDLYISTLDHILTLPGHVNQKCRFFSKINVIANNLN